MATYSRKLSNPVVLTIGADAIADERKKMKGAQGRPAIHPFSGRITFRREEVRAAMESPTIFKRDMDAAHGLTPERATTLKERGYCPTQDTKNYTFQGGMQFVLDEIAHTLERHGLPWQYQGTGYDNQKRYVEWSVNFRKVGTLSKTTDKDYLGPITNGDKANEIIYWIEALPEHIYGYVQIATIPEPVL